MSHPADEPEYPWLGRWDATLLRIMRPMRYAAVALSALMFVCGVLILVTVAGFVEPQWLLTHVAPHARSLVDVVVGVTDWFTTFRFYAVFGSIVLLGVFLSSEPRVRIHFLEHAPTPPRLHRRLREVFTDMSADEVDALVRQLVGCWLAVAHLQAVGSSAIPVRMRKALKIWAEDPASLRRWHRFAYGWRLQNPTNMRIGDSSAFFAALDEALAADGGL
jgi:hypothetical protein